MASVHDVLSTPPEFCTVCGSILPVLTASATDKCLVCREPVRIRSHAQYVEVHADEQRDIVETKSYVIHFNAKDVYSSKNKTSANEEGRKGKKPVAEGPRVERQCPQCDSTKMTYATVQLRSADEGQTVFYTCPKCGFKDNENS